MLHDVFARLFSPPFFFFFFFFLFSSPERLTLAISRWNLTTIIRISSKSSPDNALCRQNLVIKIQQKNCLTKCEISSKAFGCAVCKEEEKPSPRHMIWNCLDSETRPVPAVCLRRQGGRKKKKRGWENYYVSVAGVLRWVSLVCEKPEVSTLKRQSGGRVHTELNRKHARATWTCSTDFDFLLLLLLLLLLSFFLFFTRCGPRIGETAETQLMKWKWS